MRAAESPGHRQPALAALLAAALHAALLMGARSAWQHSPPRQRPVPVAPEIELLITHLGAPLDPQADETSAPPSAVAPLTWLPASPARHQHTQGQEPIESAPPVPTEGDTGPTADESEATEPPSRSPGNPPLRTIDLGLNDGLRRTALRDGWLERPLPPSRPSDGGLHQGLAALDAERGLSRSSPAQHAAYAAAQSFAPPTGMGIFDVTANEQGVVLSVTLVSAHATESEWQRVAHELQQLLKGRRMRVPPGAKGLAARLRIETGDLAQDMAERSRSKRGAALGQAPVHAREMRAESTRSSLEPGQLSPTLAITIGGQGQNSNIRVVLLDEHAL